MVAKKANGSFVDRYLAALFTPVAVAGVMQATWPFFDGNPLMLYLLAVILSAWYGGFGPGLLSVVSSLLLADFFFMKPYFAFWLSEADNLVQLLIFAIVGPFISVMSELLHRERRRAEVALQASRASEERYRKLAENFPNGAVITYDKELRVTFIAGGGVAETGETPEFFRGKLIDEIAPPEVVALVKPHFRAAFEGQTEIYECPFPDGRLYLAAVAPLVDSNGLISEILVISQNITAWVRAEEQVRFQASILHQVRNAVIATDLEGKIVFWNTFAEELYQWKAQETLGKSVLKLLVPEDNPDVEREIMKAMTDTGHWDGELVARRKDGSEFPSYSQYVVITGPSGAIVGFVGISTDISERKHAEEELSKAASIVDSSDDAIISKTLDGIITSWNNGAARLYGYSPPEVIGQPITILIPPEFPDEFAQIMKKVRRGEMFDHYETMRIRKDGTRIHVSLSVSPIKDVAGTVTGASAIARDITERKLGEEALRESEEKFSKAFHSNPAMLVLSTLDGKNEDFNQAYLDFVGFSREELLGRSTADLQIVSFEERERLLGLVQQAGGSLHNFETPVQLCDGRLCHMLLSVDVFSLRGVPHRLTTLLDITERKQAEERLRTTTEQLRALSASLQSAREEEGTRIAREIHDELGASLTTLRWDLESFDRVIAESGDQSQRQELQRRIDAMLLLTETTISTVRRISSELRPSILDDLGLVEAIGWQARQFQDRTGITCRFDSSLENLGLTREQSTAAFRIFQEALTNILRHARATTVNIQMETNDREFIMEISDNGRGITEDEKSRSQSLGLLGMQERVHLTGGNVNITGFDGNGTLVTVRIPISG